MTTKLLIPIILTLWLVPAFAQVDTTREDSNTSPKQSGCDGKAPGTANPAAVYCLEMGYEYQIVDGPNGQYGIVIFPDGTECGAWEFLQGKCGQEYSYCAKCGYGTITVSDGNDPFSKDYAVCVDRITKANIGSVTELFGLTEKAVKGSMSIEELELEFDTKTVPPPKSPADLPDSFDWRDHEGQDWMTSVKDQGGCGSCWAFAVVGTVEANYNTQKNNPDLDLDLSEQYLVSDCHTYLGYQTCCGGSNPIALEFIRDEGIPDENCMNYVDGMGCSCGGERWLRNFGQLIKVDLRRILEDQQDEKAT